MGCSKQMKHLGYCSYRIGKWWVSSNLGGGGLSRNAELRSHSVEKIFFAKCVASCEMMCEFLLENTALICSSYLRAKKQSQSYIVEEVDIKHLI